MARSSTSNKDLMSQARERLRGQWKTPVLVTLGYGIIYAIANLSEVLSLIFGLILSGPIALSFVYFYLAFIREQRLDINELKQGFSRFVPALLTQLLATLFILLWMLLLIIPGIMAALSYAVVFYVRHDQPELGPLEALKRSKALMYGNRWKLFCLGCRFFGWILLSILTLLIGFIWLLPYMQTTSALFYEDLLRSEAEETQLLTA